MADDPKDPSAKDAPNTPDPKDDLEGLGEAGKKALEAERKARKDAEKRAKAAEDRAKEFEDKDKTELEKAHAAKAAAEKERDEERAMRLRQEVAHSKGLTPAQARRITGTTKEELEADADDFLESIKPDGQGKPTGKPTEALRSGSDPTEEVEEMDPRKLADMVPRY